MRSVAQGDLRSNSEASGWLLADRDEPQELAARGRVFQENPRQLARRRPRMWLAYAAVAHTEVSRLNNHRDAQRLEMLLNAVGDLCGQLLLHLESLGKDLHNFRQFRETDNASARDVGNVCLADKRNHVMFAVAVNVDSCEQHHLVVPLNLRECARQFLRGIHRVANKMLSQCKGYSARCVHKPLAIWILSDVLEEGANVIECCGRLGVKRSVPVHGRRMIGLGPMGDPKSAHHVPGGSAASQSSIVKKVVIGVAVLVMATVVTAVLFIDAVAARIVSTAGTRVLGVSTTVRSVHLGLLSESSTVNGLVVAQPQGYAGDPMLVVDRIEVKAGLTELLGDVIVIEELVISGISVDLSELNGRINLQVVVDHVSSNQGAAPTATTPANSPGTTVTIRELRITGIRVKARLENALASGKVLDATIPDIVVKDIGTKTTVDQVAAQLSAQLMDQLILALAKAQIEGLPTSIASGLQSASSQISGFLQQGGSAIGDQLQKVGDAFKSIFDGNGK